MKFYPGFDIQISSEPMNFIYGKNVFGPVPEIRCLDDIRSSLANPDCDGPKDLYCIAMDVGKEEDKKDLIERNLLYGVVTYAAGQLGTEPIRSQGHIHAISASCNSSTSEVYEIWEGKACIYMQESGEDNPGNCYAVYGKAGDIIIVPPGWVHATVNADTGNPMTFGAWCVRDYGFDYRAVKDHHGIAYFPKIINGEIHWEENRNYSGGKLIVKDARDYPDFHLQKGVSIYEQYRKDQNRFQFVVDPLQDKELWNNYRP